MGKKKGARNRKAKKKKSTCRKRSSTSVTIRELVSEPKVEPKMTNMEFPPTTDRAKRKYRVRNGNFCSVIKGCLPLRSEYECLHTMHGPARVMKFKEAVDLADDFFNSVEDRIRYLASADPSYCLLGGRTDAIYARITHANITEKSKQDVLLQVGIIPFIRELKLDGTAVMSNIPMNILSLTQCKMLEYIMSISEDEPLKSFIEDRIEFKMIYEPFGMGHGIFDCSKDKPLALLKQLDSKKSRESFDIIAAKIIKAVDDSSCGLIELGREDELCKAKNTKITSDNDTWMSQLVKEDGHQALISITPKGLLKLIDDQVMACKYFPAFSNSVILRLRILANSLQPVTLLGISPRVFLHIFRSLRNDKCYLVCYHNIQRFFVLLLLKLDAINQVEPNSMPPMKILTKIQISFLKMFCKEEEIMDFVRGHKELNKIYDLIEEELYHTVVEEWYKYCQEMGTIQERFLKNMQKKTSKQKKPVATTKSTEEEGNTSEKENLSVTRSKEVKTAKTTTTTQHTVSTDPASVPAATTSRERNPKHDTQNPMILLEYKQQHLQLAAAVLDEEKESSEIASKDNLSVESELISVPKDLDELLPNAKLRMITFRQSVEERLNVLAKTSPTTKLYDFYPVDLLDTLSEGGTGCVSVDDVILLIGRNTTINNIPKSDSLTSSPPKDIFSLSDIDLLMNGGRPLTDMQFRSIKDKCNTHEDRREEHARKKNESSKEKPKEKRKKSENEARTCSSSPLQEKVPTASCSVKPSKPAEKVSTTTTTKPIVAKAARRRHKSLSLTISPPEEKSESDDVLQQIPVVELPPAVKCSLCTSSSIQPTEMVFYRASCTNDCLLVMHKHCLNDIMADRKLKKKKDLKEQMCFTNGCEGDLLTIFETNMANQESIYFKCNEKKSQSSCEPSKVEKKKKDNGSREVSAKDKEKERILDAAVPLLNRSVLSSNPQSQDVEKHVAAPAQAPVIVAKREIPLSAGIPVKKLERVKDAIEVKYDVNGTKIYKKPTKHHRNGIQVTRFETGSQGSKNNASDFDGEPLYKHRLMGHNYFYGTAAEPHLPSSYDFISRTESFHNSQDVALLLFDTIEQFPNLQPRAVSESELLEKLTKVDNMKEILLNTPMTPMEVDELHETIKCVLCDALSSEDLKTLDEVFTYPNRCRSFIEKLGFFHVTNCNGVMMYQVISEKKKSLLPNPFIGLLDTVRAQSPEANMLEDENQGVCSSWEELCDTTSSLDDIEFTEDLPGYESMSSPDGCKWNDSDSSQTHEPEDANAAEEPLHDDLIESPLSRKRTERRYLGSESQSSSNSTDSISATSSGVSSSKSGESRTTQEDVAKRMEQALYRREKEKIDMLQAQEETRLKKKAEFDAALIQSMSKWNKDTKVEKQYLRPYGAPPECVMAQFITPMVGFGRPSNGIPSNIKYRPSVPNDPNHHEQNNLPIAVEEQNIILEKQTSVMASSPEADEAKANGENQDVCSNWEDLYEDEPPTNKNSHHSVPLPDARQSSTPLSSSRPIDDDIVKKSSESSPVTRRIEKMCTTSDSRLSMDVTSSASLRTEGCTQEDVAMKMQQAIYKREKEKNDMIQAQEKIRLQKQAEIESVFIQSIHKWNKNARAEVEKEEELRKKQAEIHSVLMKSIIECNKKKQPNIEKQEHHPIIAPLPPSLLLLQLHPPQPPPPPPYFNPTIMNFEKPQSPGLCSPYRKKDRNKLVPTTNGIHINGPPFPVSPLNCVNTIPPSVNDEVKALQDKLTRAESNIEKMILKADDQANEISRMSFEQAEMKQTEARLNKMIKDLTNENSNLKRKLECQSEEKETKREIDIENPCNHGNDQEDEIESLRKELNRVKESEEYWRNEFLRLQEKERREDVKIWQEIEEKRKMEKEECEKRKHIIQNTMEHCRTSQENSIQMKEEQHRNRVAEDLRRCESECSNALAALENAIISIELNHFDKLIYPPMPKFPDSAKVLLNSMRKEAAQSPKKRFGERNHENSILAEEFHPIKGRLADVLGCWKIPTDEQLRSLIDREIEWQRSRWNCWKQGAFVFDRNAAVNKILKTHQSDEGENIAESSSEVPKKELVKSRQIELTSHICVICCEELLGATKDTGYVTCEECSEPYHTKCMNEWLLKSKERETTSTCPKCRRHWPHWEMFPRLS